jgi:hypothetical protein
MSRRGGSDVPGTGPSGLGWHECLLMAACLLVPAGSASALTCADLDGASIFSSEARPLYLGFLGDGVAQDSINNSLGAYGSPQATASVRNKLGPYGSESAPTGANNASASIPPKIVKDGSFIAYLSTNGQLDWPGIPLANLDAVCTFQAAQAGSQFLKAGTIGWGGVDVSLGGSWWNPNRSGEGFVFDFFTNGARTGVVVYFYTYDLNRNPIFLVGSADVVPGTTAPVVVDVKKPRGASFGPGFDPADVVREPWGTLTVEFLDCANARVSWVSTIAGYGSGTTNITRLVPLGTGITCP